MEYPVCKLVACTYSELPKHTPVINKHNFEAYIWIELPHELSEELELYGLQNLSDDGNTDIMFSGFIKRENCWLKVSSAILDSSPGQHIYKLGMINTSTHDIVSFFVSYILQDDNPEKSYVYMKRNPHVESCGCRDCKRCEVI